MILKGKLMKDLIIRGRTIERGICNGQILYQRAAQTIDLPVQQAGGVFCYDARYDAITGNGVTADRSGKGNNVTWVNFAGTSASGLVTESGKVFRRFNGVNNYGTLFNTTSIDITTAPLGIFATVKVVSGTVNSPFLFAKSDGYFDGMQYGMTLESSNTFVPVLDGTLIPKSLSYSRDIFFNIGFIWDGANIKIYKNISTVSTPAAFSATLTSVPIIRIGKQEGGSYAKVDLATLTVYAGVNATETKILQAESTLSAGYIV